MPFKSREESIPSLERAGMIRPLSAEPLAGLEWFGSATGRSTAPGWLSYSL